MIENRTFSALANPVRRRLLELLIQGPRSPGDLAREFRLSRSAVSEHLGVLRRADLVQDRQIGRERRYELSSQSFQRLDAWLVPFQRYWSDRLDAMSDVLDEMP